MREDKHGRRERGTRVHSQSVHRLQEGDLENQSCRGCNGRYSMKGSSKNVYLMSSFSIV